jgi:hypothetical protein
MQEHILGKNRRRCFWHYSFSYPRSLAHFFHLASRVLFHHTLKQPSLGGGGYPVVVFIDLTYTQSNITRLVVTFVVTLSLKLNLNSKHYGKTGLLRDGAHCWIRTYECLSPPSNSLFSGKLASWNKNEAYRFIPERDQSGTIAGPSLAPFLRAIIGK